MDLSGFDKPGFTGNTNAVKSAPKPQQAKSLGGVKGFLVNSLPAIGGGLGAVAGIPGDLLSAGGASVAGGTVGAGAGEALKQRILGQSISPKQVAIQAAEGGVASGIGSAVKGGQTAAKSLANLGLKGAQDVPETANVAEKAAVARATPTVGQKLSNTILNKGNRLEATLGAFAPGQKVGGQQLDTAASQRIAQTLQNEKINALGAPERLSQAEDKLNELGKTHSTLTETNNAALSDEDKQAINNEINDRLTNPNNPKFQAGGSSSTVQKYAQNYANEITKADDLNALGKEKTGLDNNEINYKTTTDAASNARNLAAKTTRGVINDFMNDKVPGLKEVNGRMSNLFEAKGALMNASGKLAGVTTGSEGLTGRLFSGSTAENAKALGAKALQKTGKTLGAETKETVPATEQDASTVTPSLLGGLEEVAKNTATLPIRTAGTAIANPVKSSGSIAKQLLTRGAGNLITNPPQENKAADSSSTSLPNVSGTASESQNTDQSSVYPEANMLYDIERDPKNASSYEALYKLTNADAQSTAQQNDSDNATNALSALQIYANNLQAAGGAQSGILGSLEKLGVKTHLVQGPQAGAITALKGFKAELAGQLAKTVTGSRPNQSQIDYYMDALPDVNDTPAAVKQKLANLQAVLQARLNNSKSSTSTSSVLNALSGLGQ